MIEAIHDFLREHGFTQVETPMLQTLAGGAASRPFVTHHNALDVDVYLRISVELYLNRCIVGGLENIYDLGRAFRNEGISHRHSPEFTILEWMMSYADYWDVAKFTEDMAESVALRTLGTTKVEQYDGRVVDLATPWRRITLREAIADAVGIDYLEASREQLIEAAGEARAGMGGIRSHLGEAGGCDLRQARRTDAARADARLRLPRRPVSDLQAPLRGSATLRALRLGDSRDGDPQRRHRAQRSGGSAQPLRDPAPAGLRTGATTATSRSPTTRSTCARSNTGWRPPPAGGSASTGC